MSMYNYGSEAVELANNEDFEINTVKTESRAKVRMSAQKSEAMKKNALKALGVTAAVLAVVMAREAQIDKLCGEISKEEKAIGQLDAMIAEKEIYLSGQFDLNMIEEIAVSRLGMQKPDPTQRVEIAIKTEEGGEILTEQTETGTGFSAFINKAKNLLEYLY